MRDSGGSTRRAGNLSSTPCPGPLRLWPGGRTGSGAVVGEPASVLGPPSGSGGGNAASSLGRVVPVAERAGGGRSGTARAWSGLQGCQGAQ